MRALNVDKCGKGYLSVNILSTLVRLSRVSIRNGIVKESMLPKEELTKFGYFAKSCSAFCSHELVSTMEETVCGFNFHRNIAHYTFGKRIGQTIERVIVSSAFDTNPHCYIMVDGFLVDTGSKVSIVPKKFSNKAIFPDRNLPKLFAANGTNIQTYGRCPIHLTILGTYYKFSAIVANVNNPILGMDFFLSVGKNILIDPASKSLKLKPQTVSSIVDTNSCEQKALQLFAKYPNLVNSSLGSIDSLTIPLRIETRDSLTKVDKILTDKYPLPHLSTFNARMSDCKYFSKVDLRRAYHQIPVHPDDQVKSTINTTLGLFKFKRMPYGLKNAGACFQRNINLILSRLNAFTYVYMDDVIIFSSTVDEHIDHLEQLFQTLSKHKILVNSEKCIFGKDSVKFLGHQVTSKGLSIPKDKVESVLNYPRPNNVKELEKFLGMFAFLHRFIKKASTIVAPLQDLRKTKSNKDFLKTFSDVHMEAFQNAKQAIAEATLLAHPKDNSLTELWTDASDCGMGATLVQLQNQAWQPLAFWSKSFNQAQRSYAAFDKEMLAISYSIQHFRNFIEGQPITVRTDHKPLVFALTKKSDAFTPLQRRHLSFISQFIDKIYYRKGEENVVADTLSRIPENDFTTECSLIKINSIANSVLPSPNDFRKAQDDDQGLQTWIEKHSNAATKFQPKLVACADADVTVWADASQDPPKILVPTKYQKQVFDHFHNLNHSGFKSCFKLITRTHYWPNSKREIKEWCQECITCQTEQNQQAYKNIFATPSSTKPTLWPYPCGSCQVW